jgi:adenosine deaminase
VDQIVPIEANSPIGLADLHRHLDGSLRRTTLDDLAAHLGIAVPANLVFLPGMGLADALACFTLTLSVLQQPDAVKRVAADICEDAAAEGVTTLEIRFAPQLHRGATPAEIVDAAIEGIDGRAGLVLCGLYGEPPTVLTDLVLVAKSRPGVVGIDLAGGPAKGHVYRLQDYVEPFTMARDTGLGRTVHASEGRPPGEIFMAIKLLHADRIGHGTTVLNDPDIVNLVLARGVTLEANITSNWHVGAIPDLSTHPLPKWLRRGIRACVCTDNTLFSAVDAQEEYRRARSLPGMNDALLAQAIAYGHAAAFKRKSTPRRSEMENCGDSIGASCSFCGERLDRSLHRNIDGRAIKSCPHCSTMAGYHVFYFMEDFGERVVDGEAYDQSWCLPCRSKDKPKASPACVCSA